MKLFTIIDRSTGMEAITADVVREEWANNIIDPRIRLGGWIIDEYGGIGIQDRCNNSAWAPMDRFEIRWNREAKA